MTAPPAHPSSRPPAAADDDLSPAAADDDLSPAAARDELSPVAAADLSALTLRPIGVVRSPFLDKRSAPRQPAAARDVTATIHLFPRPGMEHAVCDLDGCTHLWIVFWFHQAHDFRPKVLPPRSHARRGVLATRSPHRPNPIGLSVARLERVDGLVLHIRDVDMLDGTPVLDVKPYVAYADSVPDARVAWLQPLVSESDAAGGAGGDGGGGSGGGSGSGGPIAHAPADPVPAFTVTFDPAAEAVLGFLRASFDLDLGAQITAVLTLGPQPHPYRRIRKIDGGLQLAVKDWRARFTTHGRQVHVTAIDSGYRPKELAPTPGEDPARSALLAPHRAVRDRFH